MEQIRETAALLAVKECDLRADILLQCRTAVDKGVHIGGAYSAVPILAALYYGGCMDYNVEHPTEGGDLFILSKGHAVAAMAAVYADLGYFDRKYLQGSRGGDSLIKGHPGPIIPGVPVSTGPLGQGISIACGFALGEKERRGGDVFCMVGDGELQEGACWEGLLVAQSMGLHNFCLLVDQNNGQSDNTARLVQSIDPLEDKLRGFGYRVLPADAGDPGSILAAIERFKEYPRPLEPTAIICRSVKGIGGYAGITGKHKASIDDATLDKEQALLEHARRERVGRVAALPLETIRPLAEGMGYTCRTENGRLVELERAETAPKVRPAPARDKALRYRPADLPTLVAGERYAPAQVMEQVCAVFAQDPRFYTIDADLSNISALYTGTAHTNRTHAINVGIAECTMMCMAEGLAAGGSNVWTSTFAPFFNLQALRRIAVSYQERQEAIAEGGWLTRGHNLDITFMATASNLDTAVNGATHMANDDMQTYGQIAHLKVIDVSCPRQLLAIAQWIGEGEKGLVYLRTMRGASPVLYHEDFVFQYGKGYLLREGAGASPVIVSSGHGVLEALEAAKLLEREGINAAVLDLPSFDGPMLEKLLADRRPLLFAEQNNGALFDRFSRHLLLRGRSVPAGRIHRISTLDGAGEAGFIHSDTYEQLLERFGLTPRAIAEKVKSLI